MSAPIADKVEPATIPVPLSQVRLLDGPFLDSLNGTLKPLTSKANS